jgi:hypothetical protein
MASNEINLANVQISNVNIAGTGWMLGEGAKYTANTGIQTISVANTGLDGGGTLVSILTAASNGTLIKTVTIKSQTSNPGDIVRLYLYNGTTSYLLTEIEVEPTAGGKSSLYHTYGTVIPLNFNLQSGYILKASTNAGKTYNVIADGLNWVFP